MTEQIPNHNLKKLKELMARLSQTDRIFEMGNGISNIIPDEEMYEKVLKIVLEFTESKYGIFGYIDADGAFVCPSMTKGVWEQCEVIDKDIVFSPETWGDSIWGRSIREKKTLYANKSFSVPDGHIPIDRALMVPIMYRKNVIGLFEVANKESDYDEKDIHLLETIAVRIAPILNARLRYQQMEEELAEIKKTLERSHGT